MVLLPPSQLIDDPLLCMDAEPNDDVFTGRMLRRAENILTANNGKLIKELEQQSDTASTSSQVHDDPLADRSRQLRRLNTFGASFVRKLKDVKTDAAKLLRTRSLNGRSKPSESEAPKARKGHSRSLSEFQQVRPAGPKHSDSAPAALSTSGLHKRALSDVAEGSMIMSPTEQREAPETEAKSGADVVVPHLLQMGTPMTKVSAKKHKKAVFRLDADLGQIVWESKQQKISECYPDSLSALR